MIKRIPHHIEMLNREFSKRKATNARYSLRAFAKSLGMSSATLSRVLSDTQEISLAACKKIIKTLKLTEHECVVFVRSVAEEKCNRAYKVLSTTLEPGTPFPHERSLMFVSNLEGRCIFHNEEAAKFKNKLLEEKIAEVMANIGFSPCVVKFIEECMEKVVIFGEPMKLNLPIETTVGTLAIESLFSPLLSEEGKVKAVSSMLVNLNLEVIKHDVSLT